MAYQKREARVVEARDFRGHRVYRVINDKGVVIAERAMFELATAYARSIDKEMEKR